MSRFEFNTDIASKTITVSFKDTGHITTVVFNDNHWVLHGADTFCLYDFIGIIQSVTNHLVKNYNKGKFAKINNKQKGIAQKWATGKFIRLIAKCLSAEMHAFLQNADKDVVELHKMFHKCVGNKYTWSEISIFFDRSFLSSQLFKDCCKYRVAMYAFIDNWLRNKNSTNASYASFDWKRYFCYKKKLNKNYIETFKHLNYVIPIHYLQKLSKEPMRRVCKTKAELLLYIAAFEKEDCDWSSVRLDNKLWNIILAVKDREIKKSIRFLRKFGFDISCRKNYHQLISALIESKYKYDSLYENIVQSTLEKNNKILRQLKEQFPQGKLDILPPINDVARLTGANPAECSRACQDRALCA